jgi:hypothetical protein
MKVFCPKREEDTNYKSNTSSEAVSPITEHEELGEVCTKGGRPSVVTTALIVIGVLLGCALGGGLILVMVVKRLRNKTKTPEYWDVYGHRASYVSIQSYPDIGSEPSHVSVQSYEDVGSEQANVSVQSYANVGSEPSYVSVQSYVDVGSEPSHVSVQSYADVGSEPSHVSVQSYADVGSDRSNASGYTYVEVQ